MIFCRASRLGGRSVAVGVAALLLATAAPLVGAPIASASDCVLTGMSYEQKKLNCAGAQLEGMNLVGQDLHNGNFSGAKLMGANLTNANFIRANLTGADLTGATLTGAKLNLAHLTGATLTGANLNRSQVRGTNFTSANLTNIKAAGVRLNDWTIITDAIITGSDFMPSPEWLSDTVTQEDLWEDSYDTAARSDSPESNPDRFIGMVHGIEDIQCVDQNDPNRTVWRARKETYNIKCSVYGKNKNGPAKGELTLLVRGTNGNFKTQSEESDSDSSDGHG